MCICRLCVYVCVYICVYMCICRLCVYVCVEVGGWGWGGECDGNSYGSTDATPKTVTDITKTRGGCDKTSLDI